MDIVKKLGLKVDAPPNRDELQEQRRAYERSLGPLLEDAHQALDAKVGGWRERLKARVADGIPESPQHPSFWVIACLDSMIEAAPRFHALLDELAAQGQFDVTSKADVEAKRAEFANAELAISLAEEEAEVARLEAEAKARRAGLDARMQEALES